MKTYLIGDIHGEYQKLINCLKQVNFNYKNDCLIQLGDVVDRGPQSYECVEELLKINNLIAIRGNHDAEWLKYLKTKNKEDAYQKETILSYENNNVDPMVHFDFFNNQINIFRINDILFVHGGINRHKSIDAQEEQVLYWDRDFFMSAMSYKSSNAIKQGYKFKLPEGIDKVFIGHTPTTLWDIKKPINTGQVINLDTGAGKDGLLTIWNLDTSEYYQN